jgi:hypothetical protein
MVDFIPDLSLIEYFIFPGPNGSSLFLRRKQEFALSPERLVESLANAQARLVFPQLDCIASVMPQIRTLYPDINHMFLRMLAREDVRCFLDGLTNGGQVSGFLTAAAEKAAIDRCIERGIDSLAYLWNEKYVDYCVVKWFGRHGRQNESRVHQVGFLPVLDETIQQINGIVDEFYFFVE